MAGVNTQNQNPQQDFAQIQNPVSKPAGTNQYCRNDGSGFAWHRCKDNPVCFGLNCVEYKNGARHTLADYAEMAFRTASKRAYLQGGEKRQEWGSQRYRE